MEISASSFGLAKIVDSFLTGKGASFSLNLRTSVRIKDADEKFKVCNNSNNNNNNNNNKSDIVRTDVVKCLRKSVDKVFEKFGCDYSVEVDFTSDVPNGLGFKCSLINSAVLASIGFVAKKSGQILNSFVFKDLRDDKYSKDKILKIDGRFISDSEIFGVCLDVVKELNFTSECPIEDLNASFFGGFYVADNNVNKILRFGGNESLHAFVLLPDNINKKNSFVKHILKNELDVAFNETLKGNLYLATNLNSLIYMCIRAYDWNFEVFKGALSAGVKCCSLSNGVFVAVFKDESIKDTIRSKWGSFGRKLIETTTNNEKANLMEI